MSLALVTGASRGIGRAVAWRMAAEGCQVVCCGRSSDTVTRTAAELPGSGHLGIQVPDMREMTKETADEVVRAVVKETGKKLHYVAHVAGIAPSSLLMRTHPDEIDELLRINVTGPLMLTRSALQYGGLLSQSSGSAVCFVGSVVGERGNKGQVAYAASKAALSGAAKSLAKEYGGKGLRVNVVAPGFISTDLTADIPERARAAIAEATALGRFGTAEEVADAVHFALTATFLTGQTILLDGGLTI